MNIVYLVIDIFIIRNYSFKRFEVHSWLSQHHLVIIEVHCKLITIVIYVA